MSSTHHARHDAPLAQGRYMSSPEYAELRGLCGSAVAAKIAILDDPRARSLILFLDALSRRDGGLMKVGVDTVALVPRLKRSGGLSPLFLADVCINPRVRVDASCPLIDALLEFKARYGQAAAARIAETEITRAVSRTLSRGLRTRKIVVVNGREGLGKSFAVEEVWGEQNLGSARYVRGKGIVNKTTLFQSISRACGLAAGVQQKSQEMQTRIETYLERSGVMLIIDEAHRLFSQTQRMSAHPEMVNWIYTLWDMKIPVALVTTPQILDLMDTAERQTGWNSGQFKRRVEKWTQLPDRLSEQDLRAVARNLAPCFSKSMIDELVDFALPARCQLDALKRALSAAEEFSTEAGRETPNARDLDEGIKDAQATDLALTTPLDRERQTGIRAGRRRQRRVSAAALPQAPGDTDAEPLPLDADAPDFAAPESAPPAESRHAPPRAARPVSVAV